MTTTVINDAPISIDPALTGGQRWEPKNYDGKFEGPMTLRTALAKSKNMVSIRVARGDRPAVRTGLRDALRLRRRAPPPVPDDGAGRRLGHAAGRWRGAIFGVRQRRLPGRPLPDGTHHRHRRPAARQRPPGARRRRVAARDRRAQRLPDGFAAARRGARWAPRRARAVAPARRPGRQDRHHQRFDRRLVRRLPAGHRGDRLGRVRPAAQARRPRDRRRARAADLDRLHANRRCEAFPNGRPGCRPGSSTRTATGTTTRPFPARAIASLGLVEQDPSQGMQPAGRE